MTYRIDITEPLEPAAERKLFDRRETAYIPAHKAIRGCVAAKVERS